MTQPNDIPQNELTIDGLDSGVADFLDNVDSPVVDGQEQEQEVPEKAPEPSFDERLREREAQIAQREAQVAQQERDTQVRNAAKSFYDQQYRQYVQTYTQQGYSQSEASELSKQLAIKDTQAGITQYKEKLTLERLVAREEDVPVEILKEYWDEATMRQRAQNYKATGGADKAELENLRREISELRQQMGKAPLTQYNRTGSAGTGSGVTYAEYLKSGKPMPSAAEVDRMTRRFLER